MILSRSMHADPWARFDDPKDDDRPVTDDYAIVELYRRAGADVPALESLAAAIWQDMDPTVHGIGWWTAVLDERSRILVGDHLFRCVHSVADNLLEACLHKIAALHAMDAEDARLARVVGVDMVLKFPKAASARELLPDKLVRLHIAGFFRSLGSILDCLAAAIVGVLGLPENILRADFKQLRKKLPEHRGHQLWIDFERDLSNLIASNGPTNWDVWVSDYRNMLVHRARRIEIGTLKPMSHVLDARGRQVPRTYIIPHLVRDPNLSDVEAMARQIGRPTVNLEENGRNTIESVFVSTRETVAGAAALLLKVWEQRRATPCAIPQPAAQWPAPGGRVSGFTGFEPGSEPFAADAMYTDSEGHDRVRFAGLDDKTNAIWKGYF